MLSIIFEIRCNISLLFFFTFRQHQRVLLMIQKWKYYLKVMPVLKLKRDIFIVDTEILKLLQFFPIHGKTSSDLRIEIGDFQI